MPRIEITAKLWPQIIDGDRFERRFGDVVEVSEADAARLIKAGAAKPSKRKVSVSDQKDAADAPTPEPAPTAPEADTPAEKPGTLLTPEQIDMEMPANSAKTELWQEYAIAAGMAEDVARSMKREDIRPLFQ